MTDIHSYYKKLGILGFEGHSQQCESETKFLKNIVNDDIMKNVLEIGFNAGHSADTFLSSNLTINLVSFDLGEHDYVKLGKEYIDEKYPGRHELILGDSKVTIPEYISNNKLNKQFDLIFIDGGHKFEQAKRDILNCKKLAHSETIVIMDDTMNRDEWIKSWNIGPNQAWNEAIAYDYIIPLGFKDFSDTHGLSWGKYTNLPIKKGNIIRIGGSDKQIKVMELNKFYPSDTKLSFKHNFKDTFSYIFKDKKLIIKRKDENCGWGQNLIGYLDN